MTKIRQAAGTVSIEVYTDGSPLWPEIKFEASNGTQLDVRTDINSLHDLRYCINRVLAQLPKDPA